jgi:hypothetical protein
MERGVLIAKLLDTGHLNVPERKALGLAAITFPELRNAMELILHQHGWFPSNSKTHNSSAPVFEGHFIERASDGKFLLHYQRSQAIAPHQLAESSSEEFPDLDTAARTYLDREHQNSIDGIPLAVT